MSDEHFLSDSEFEDDEFGDVYLVEEPEDVDLLLLPKLNVDIDKILTGYAKQLRKCKTIGEAKEILHELYAYAQLISMIQMEITDIQSKVKSLEILKNEFDFDFL